MTRTEETKSLYIKLSFIERLSSVQEGNQEDGFSIPMSELIPNLENFDPQILNLLPPKVRKGEL